MGVAEHNFEINIYGKSVMWHLYDVGGARGQRHTWVVSDLFSLLARSFMLTFIIPFIIFVFVALL
jgi:hypothetical protein